MVVFDGFWDKKVEFRFWRTDIFTENYNDSVLLSYPSKFNELTPGQLLFLCCLAKKNTKIGVLFAHSINKSFFLFSHKIALMKYKNMAVLVVFDGFWDKKSFRFWRTDICTTTTVFCFLIYQNSMTLLQDNNFSLFCLAKRLQRLASLLLIMKLIFFLFHSKLLHWNLKIWKFC